MVSLSKCNVMLVNRGIFLCSSCRCKRMWSLPPPPPNEDESVAKERRRVLRGDCDGDLLVLNNLTKVYGGCSSSQLRLAVNQLCLRMQKAEVRSHSNLQ